MTARLIAKLTDVISEVQQALGIEATRKLLIGLARGLGKSEVNTGTGSSRPGVRPRVGKAG